MRSIILALVVIAGCAGVLLTIRALARHRLELTSYFADARGLRKGAQVRVAGLEVGRVSRITTRPEMREHPVEVKMTLLTDYDLAVPDDSTASLQTAGVLGETFVAISLQGAAGPRVPNGGTLKSVEISEPNYPQLLQQFVDTLHNCDSVVEKAGKSPRTPASTEAASKK